MKIVEPVGEEGPSQVHGGSSEESAADAEEESDHHAYDVFGAITEGADNGGGRGGGRARQESGTANDGLIIKEEKGGFDGAELGEDGEELRGVRVRVRVRIRVFEGGEGVGDEEGVTESGVGCDDEGKKGYGGGEEDPRAPRRHCWVSDFPDLGDFGCGRLSREKKEVAERGRLRSYLESSHPLNR